MKATEQLHGWKSIALHFNRSVRCVQRWEHKERLPVHRHAHSRGASVYALRRELDAWWEKEQRYGAHANILAASLAKRVDPDQDLQRDPTCGVTGQSDVWKLSGKERDLAELIVERTALAILQALKVSLRGNRQQIEIRNSYGSGTPKLSRNARTLVAL